MVHAVIDTNVLVSAFWTFGSPSHPMRVLRALVEGKFGRRNLKHYPESPIVVTPAEFCEMLGI